jgi:hypothetical protein
MRLLTPGTSGDAAGQQEPGGLIGLVQFSGFMLQTIGPPGCAQAAVIPATSVTNVSIRMLREDFIKNSLEKIDRIMVTATRLRPGRIPIELGVLG